MSKQHKYPPHFNERSDCLQCKHSHTNHVDGYDWKLLCKRYKLKVDIGDVCDDFEKGEGK